MWETKRVWTNFIYTVKAIGSCKGRQTIHVHLCRLQRLKLFELLDGGELQNETIRKCRLGFAKAIAKALMHSWGESQRKQWKLSRDSHCSKNFPFFDNFPMITNLQFSTKLHRFQYCLQNGFTYFIWTKWVSF